MLDLNRKYANQKREAAKPKTTGKKSVKKI